MGGPGLQILAAERWRQMPGDRPFLVSRATPAEAVVLRDPAVRTEVDAWFRERRRGDPRLRGLIIFVHGEDRVVGFVEMIGHGDVHEWRGHDDLGDPSFGIVLVVEDDDDLRDAIVDALHQQGYTAPGARDGLEALAMLEAMSGSIAADAIVLDLGMPVMDGREFLAARAAIPSAAAIPVAVISGSPPDRNLEAGVWDEFVPKPISVGSLLEVVGRLCARRSAR